MKKFLVRLLGRPAVPLAMFALVLVGAAPHLYAQSTGAYVDACSSETVDYSQDVEETVCLSGSDTGLYGTAYVSAADYGGYLPSVGLGLQIYDGGSLVYDSGDQQNSNSTDGSVSSVNVNHTYTLDSWYDECYDGSGSNDSVDCSWYTYMGGPSVEAEVTPSLGVISSNLTSAHGTYVTFTASISGGITGGTVTFYDGATSLGTATLGGSGAALSINSLATGAHSITAYWPGNGSYGPFTSDPITQSIYVPGPLQPPPAGIINTLVGNGVGSYAGDSGDALPAELSGPTGVTFDAAGNLYIADQFSSRIRKVSAATGIITTVAGNGTLGFSGDGGYATSAELNHASGVAVDGTGNLYIADFGNSRIRKVDAVTGIISTVAGNGTAGFSGDGGAATSAELNLPFGVVVDAARNLYIVDMSNHRIRKVNASTGVISTIAGNGSEGYFGDSVAATSTSLFYPSGVALDAAGNVYIADTYNERIRKVSAATGIITTVAGGGSGALGNGGAATSATLGDPVGVIFDAAGDMFIAEYYHPRIREVNATTGIIQAVAGSGTLGYAGDGGPAVSAALAYPYGMALDLSGNLYFADSSNNRVRAVGIAPPVIASISPASGAIGSTGSITVTGTGLVDSFGACGVAMSGGISATVSCSSSTSVTVSYSIPSTAFAGPKTLTISNSAGVSNPASFTVQPSSSLSTGSGINSSDTYVVFDINLQSSGTLNLATPVATGASTTISTLSAQIKHTHYHVEAGFDTSDQSVLNITPTDLIDPSTLPTQMVTMVQIRSNKIILYDGNGNSIPITAPGVGAMGQPLFALGLPTHASLTALLAPSNMSALASSIGATITSGGGTGSVTTLAASLSSSSQQLTYQPNGSTWKLSQLVNTRVDSLSNSVSDSISYSVTSSNTNSTGDARRAASSPASPSPSSAPLISPSDFPPLQPAATDDTAIVGPGAGAPLTLIHGLGGSSKSWNTMKPWLQGDMMLGAVTSPTLGASDALADQTDTLYSINSGGGPTVLIGHSQGGLIARRFGELYPSLVDGIITIDTPHQGALIAVTGPYAAISGIAYALLSRAHCTSVLGAPSCAAAALLFGGLGIAALDGSSPNFQNLVPGSSFLNTVNGATETVPRFSIESHSNKRWVLPRVVADSNPLCSPASWCGGRAAYDLFQVVYYYEIARAVVDVFWSFFDPFQLFDIYEALDTIAAMDAMDDLWDLATGAIGDSTDGVVPGSSQSYPNSDAHLIIQDADSHPGNLKSDLVKNAVEYMLETQFAVPATGCEYTDSSSYGVGVIPTVPFYGQRVAIGLNTGVGPTDPSCPFQLVSQVPFAQTAPFHTLSGSDSVLIDFNLSPAPRVATWKFHDVTITYNQDGLPPNAAIGIVTLRGNRGIINPSGPSPVYDTGTVTVTVNSVPYSCGYDSSYALSQGEEFEREVVAQCLVYQINLANGYLTYGASPGPIVAGVMGDNIYIASTTGTPTSNTDYTLSVSSASSDPTDFPAPSYTLSTNAPNLIGNP